MKIPNPIKEPFTAAARIGITGALATGILLGGTGVTVALAPQASAGTYEIEQVGPVGPAHNRWQLATGWYKFACIDRPETGYRECGETIYPFRIDEDALPHYNRGTDHIDMPPEGGHHWMVKLGGGGWIDLP